MNTNAFRSRLLLFAAGLMFVPIVLHATVNADELDNPLDPRPRRVHLLIGPRVGLNRNYHTGGFHTIEGASCPKFTSGSGWGFLGGLTVEYIPGDGAWSIVPAVTFETRPGSFKQRLPDVLVLLESDPALQTITSTSEVSYRLASVEVMYKQEIWHPGKSFRLSVTAGPVAGMVLGGTITQYNDLVLPTNARFSPEAVPAGARLDETGRRMTLADNLDIPGMNAVRVSLKGGLQAEVPLFNNKVLMYPALLYDFGLTRVTRLENWSLNSMLFQVDFRRAF